MTRTSTLKRDRRIMALYLRGLKPKAIVSLLKLTNVYIVYEAIRRSRYNGAVPAK